MLKKDQVENFKWIRSALQIKKTEDTKTKKTLITSSNSLREKDETEEDDGCLQTYKQMLQILSLKNVLQYAGCIFVIKVNSQCRTQLGNARVKGNMTDKNLSRSEQKFLIIVPY